MPKLAKLIPLILGLLLVGSLIYGGMTTAERDKLSTEKTKLSQDLKQSKQREEKTRQEMAGAKAQFDEELSRRDTEKQNFNQQIADLQKTKDELEVKVAAFDQDKAKLESRIEEARNSRDELVKKLQDAQQKEKTAEDKQRALEDEIKQAKASGSAASAEAATETAQYQPSATVPAGSNNEEYWASVLRDKAGLEIELKKIKDQLSQAQIDLVELKRVSDEYKVKMDQLEHDKADVEQSLQYKSDLVNNLSIELARTKNDKKFISDRAEAMNKENADLRGQLQQLVTTKGALEKTIVKLTKEKSDVENKLGQTDSLVQSKIDEIWEIKESIDNAFQASKKDAKASNEVELPPIIVKSDGAAASYAPSSTAPGLSGKIVNVNPDNNFVIVDLGKNSGIRVGDQLSVYRDSAYVARLEVIQVRNDISAADIKDQWSKIQVGDLIR
jgi:chromosome segregation ATPase